MFVGARFIAPTADLSALGGFFGIPIILLKAIIAPAEWGEAYAGVSTLDSPVISVTNVINVTMPKSPSHCLPSLALVAATCVIHCQSSTPRTL